MSFRFALEDLNLAEAEKNLCIEALNAAGTIVDAAKLLAITRHALKRRIIKHRIDWPRKARADTAGVEAEAAENDRRTP